MDEKTCTHCKETKPIEGFSRRKSSKDGLQSWCKTCLNSRVRDWHEANRERAKALSRRWEVNNRQRVRENRRRWTERNPGYMPKYLDDWHAKNPGKLHEYLRRSNERHPEKIATRNALNKAVRRKEVVKPDSCECCQKKCSGRGLHAHHDDYDKPLEVRWLCRSCHNALHAALRDALATSHTQ
jgi:hypothetical protein